jgi:catechol 2,3-dioxygenase-like lactoylglutathione lyase family enzyme
MIQRVSHMTLYVTDQEEARKFYVEKLGFEVRTDHNAGTGFRWLTIGPKGQPDLELALIEPRAVGPHATEENMAMIRKLLSNQAFCVGILQTADCHASYNELKAKGVQFKQPPQERPYGTEAILVDNSGNWFSLCQRK